MPSVKNPNGPSQNRRAARTATARKHTAKQRARKTQAEQHQISGADARRGARAGILPTSGPKRALGGKQRRKLERKLGYALTRKMEAEGEVVMKDASTESAPKDKAQQQKQEQQKDGGVTEETVVEMDGIS